jgi:hypothetical protein
LDILNTTSTYLKENLPAGTGRELIYRLPNKVGDLFHQIFKHDFIEFLNEVKDEAEKKLKEKVNDSNVDV